MGGSPTTAPSSTPHSPTTARTDLLPQPLALAHVRADDTARSLKAACTVVKSRLNGKAAAAPALRSACVRNPLHRLGKPQRYGRAASSGTVVGNDPVNMTDPTGTESACFYGPSQCGMIQLTPQQQKDRERTVSTLATIAIAMIPAERAITGLAWIGRTLGIGIVARVTIEVAEATLPSGVTRQIFAQVGVWRTEGGVAAAATRSRAVSSEAIQGLKDAGVSKSSVATWQKFYQGKIVTVRSDGTRLINQTANYRAEVLRNVYRNW